MRKTVLFFVAGIVIVVIVTLWLSRRTPGDHAPAQLKTVSTNSQALAARAPTNEASAPDVPTNRVEVPAAMLESLNKFVAAAKLYDLDGPIRAQDIIAVVKEPKMTQMETKTHLAIFVNDGIRLETFLSTYYTSNPVVPPDVEREAMRQLYQATGKWTKEEALAETYRIMERLGIRFEISGHDVNVPEITVKNPQGERVRVTPFYIVGVARAGAGRIEAEFRVGQSGPGRLTSWRARLPLEAYQGAANASEVK